MPYLIPPASLLDKNFRYTPSFATDIRKTMKRYQRALARAEEQSPQQDLPLSAGTEPCSAKP